jgi:hypothetical protein
MCTQECDDSGGQNDRPVELHNRMKILGVGPRRSARSSERSAVNKRRSSSLEPQIVNDGRAEGVAIPQQQTCPHEAPGLLSLSRYLLLLDGLERAGIASAEVRRVSWKSIGGIYWLGKKLESYRPPWTEAMPLRRANEAIAARPAGNQPCTSKCESSPLAEAIPQTRPCMLLSPPSTTARLSQARAPWRHSGSAAGRQRSHLGAARG